MFCILFKKKTMFFQKNCKTKILRFINNLTECSFQNSIEVSNLFRENSLTWRTSSYIIIQIMTRLLTCVILRYV